MNCFSPQILVRQFVFMLKRFITPQIMNESLEFFIELPAHLSDLWFLKSKSVQAILTTDFCHTILKQSFQDAQLRMLQIIYRRNHVTSQRE